MSTCAMPDLVLPDPIVLPCRHGGGTMMWALGDVVTPDVPVYIDRVGIVADGITPEVAARLSRGVLRFVVEDRLIAEGWAGNCLWLFKSILVRPGERMIVFAHRDEPPAFMQRAVRCICHYRLAEQ